MLKKSVWMALAVLSLVLSGCMTAQERLAADDAKCQSYGAPAGSPGYVNCRMQLEQNRANARTVQSLSPGSFLLGTIQGASE